MHENSENLTAGRISQVADFRARDSSRSAARFRRITMKGNQAVRMNLVAPALGTFLLPLLLSTVGFAAEPAAGEKVFKTKCALCHTIEPGKNKIGPSLAGIVGRPSGSIAGFKYSPANLAAKVTWDEATLDKYLINPKAMIPGTIMTFPGDKNDAERGDLIAYLDTLK
jgi:cytochrome c